MDGSVEIELILIIPIGMMENVVADFYIMSKYF